MRHADAPNVEFMPADEYVGRDLYEVFPELFERFGKGQHRRHRRGRRVPVWQLGHRL